MRAAKMKLKLKYFLSVLFQFILVSFYMCTLLQINKIKKNCVVTIVSSCIEIKI